MARQLIEQIPDNIGTPTLRKLVSSSARKLSREHAARNLTELRFLFLDGLAIHDVKQVEAEEDCVYCDYSLNNNSDASDEVLATVRNISSARALCEQLFIDRFHDTLVQLCVNPNSQISRDDPGVDARKFMGLIDCESDCD